MKYNDDPKEDIFMHLAICVRSLAKKYPKNEIYDAMINMAKNKNEKERWNEPLIY